MRRRLDCAFKICDHPSNERYAAVSPSYTGDCRLLGADGLCSLQCELGERVLPSVCRQYPRSFKKGLFTEAVCSASCEAVVEALMRKAPLTFVTLLSETAVPTEGLQPETEKKAEIRSRCIGIIQDRSNSFSQRISNLGEFLCTYDRQPPADTASALAAAVALIREFSEISPAIEWYGEKAMSLIPENASSRELSAAAERYIKLEEIFRTAYPDCEEWLENIAVNHMFYEQFPYANEKGFTEAYAAFCACYALVKVIAVCACEGNYTKEAFADAVSASFRYIEHSAFDKNVNIIFRRLSYLSPSYMSGLALL